MNVLVIDDQLTVLNGIRNGVHFKELGIEEVFFATSGHMARDILSGHPIHIMLCDIEMPGENGLELNRFVSRQYPDIIRILLTSHAEFTYAQESVKLGCFDYILQPATYDEIEQVLQRAVDRFQLNEEQKAVYEKGKLFEELKPEISDRIVLNLFSRNTETSEESRKMLNKMGYPLTGTSGIRILMLDLYSFVSPDNPLYSDVRVRKILTKVSSEALGAYDSIYSLLTLNRTKQYVFLFFCNTDELKSLPDTWYKTLQESLMKELGLSAAIYISGYDVLYHLSAQILNVENLRRNNISLTPGVYFLSASAQQEFVSPNLDENVKRWIRLLENGDFSQLKENIFRYLDFISSVRRANYHTICDIHQQFTQVIFGYVYDNNISLTDLFPGDYSYNDFLEAYKNIETLKKAVEYITDALSSKIGDASEDDDITNAKNFILNNMNRDITVKEVADHVHRSPEYFTKLFKKKTGENIKTYITRVKLDAAKDMLANPNIPISLVACEIGYTNFSHFSQIFKKSENITPTEYRKQKMKESVPSSRT